MASFSFSFSGDDIEHDPLDACNGDAEDEKITTEPLGGSGLKAASSAFPVAGKPLLPALQHDLREMLTKLPSKIAYGLLDIDLSSDRGGAKDGDTSATLQIPRRELWDVRVQLMAEADAYQGEHGLEPGLDSHDVKTGIYEGGFKSWESSIDLVKVLALDPLASSTADRPLHIIELGCGTALPSLALFQWAWSQKRRPLSLTLADYNPSVLYLVTLPNFLLAWALGQRDQDPLLQEALAEDGELELSDPVKEAFLAFLDSNNVCLMFLSGGWSPDFVDLLYLARARTATSHDPADTLLVGAETIYSPYALNSFAETVLSILERERRERPSNQAAAVIGAKKLYFGVGGSLDDFVEKMRAYGTTVQHIKEESDGVRRGVVRCTME